MEGIAKAKAQGDVYNGRPKSINPEDVKKLKADGLGPTEIAKQLGIARASVYRALSESKLQHASPIGGRRQCSQMQRPSRDLPSVFLQLITLRSET